MKKINFKIDTENKVRINIFLPENIVMQINNIVKNKKDKSNGKKYGSFTHFVRTACFKLIKEETS